MYGTVVVVVGAAVAATYLALSFPAVSSPLNLLQPQSAHNTINVG